MGNNQDGSQISGSPEKKEQIKRYRDAARRNTDKTLLEYTMYVEQRVNDLIAHGPGIQGVVDYYSELPDPTTLLERSIYLVRYDEGPNENGLYWVIDSGGNVWEFLSGMNFQNASEVPIADVNDRYTATEVENALQELAGAGRTTETVKDNYDDNHGSVTVHSDVSDEGSGVIISTSERGKLGGIEPNAKDDQDADEVPIADTGSRYSASEVEGALQEIAGVGRTSETVKSVDGAARGSVAVHSDVSDAGSGQIITDPERTGLHGHSNKAEIDKIVDGDHEDRETNPHSVTAAQAGASAVGHSHDDRYYTESEIDTQMSSKSDTSHLHDGRYYTESEVDTALSGKADTSHTHNEIDVLDLDHNAQKIKSKTVDAPIAGDDTKALVYNHAGGKYEHVSLSLAGHLHDDRYYTESEIDTQMSGKSNTGHTHNEIDILDLDKYTQTEVDTALSGKSDSGHLHDTRYYTESEVDTALSGKADTVHTHLEANITNLDKYTQAEIDTQMSGKSDTSHLHTGVYSPVGHNHDTRYYTESEIDTQMSGKSDTGHNHDTRYYTESEIDTQMSGKSDTSHTHLEADVTNLDKYTQAQIDTQMGGKSDTGHTHNEVDILDLDHNALKIRGKTVEVPLAGHDGYYLKYDHGAGQYVHAAELGTGDMLKSVYDTGDNGQVDKADDSDRLENNTLAQVRNHVPQAHTHDDRYYTESEIDTQMSGKSDTGHDHTESDITDLDHDAQKIKSKAIDALAAGNDGHVPYYDHGSGTIKWTEVGAITPFFITREMSPVFNGLMKVIGWNLQADALAALASGSPVTASQEGFGSNFVFNISASVGLPYTLRVTGTSLNPTTGATTGADTEDINVTANGYYRTTKQWVDAVQLSIVEGGKSCNVDIYKQSRWNHEGTNFTVKGINFEFMPGATTWDISLSIWKVSSDGSLTVIENFSYDNTDTPPRAVKHEYGRHEVSNYDTLIDVASNEGLIVMVDQDSIDHFTLEVNCE